MDSVHITPAEEIENAASFFCTVRFAVHINPSRKRRISKTLFKPEKFENARFLFSRGLKAFWNGAFRKQWSHDNYAISVTEFSSNTNPKMTGGGAWTENI